METDEELENKIHPVIRKFFGESLRRSGGALTPGREVQFITNKGDPFAIVDTKGSVFLKDGINYYFHNEWRSEDEVLRIIKMKMFL